MNPKTLSSVGKSFLFTDKISKNRCCEFYAYRKYFPNSNQHEVNNRTCIRYQHEYCDGSAADVPPHFQLQVSTVCTINLSGRLNSFSKAATVWNRCAFHPNEKMCILYSIIEKQCIKNFVSQIKTDGQKRKTEGGKKERKEEERERYELKKIA